MSDDKPYEVGKGKPPKEHAFKPGNNMNPNGRSGNNPLTRKMTISLFKDLIEMALLGNIKDLEAIVRDPESPALKVGVATALANAIKRGNWEVIDNICSRIVGKAPIKLDVDIPIKPVTHVDPELLRAALAKIETDV